MKRKTKNAFTLIELLAVIVILAIIALIATPIILGIIEDARKDAFLRSVELVISATDLDAMNKLTDTGYEYEIVDGEISNSEVSVKNMEGMNGKIIYNASGKEVYAIHNGLYCVTKKSNMEKAEANDYVEGNCTANIEETDLTFQEFLDLETFAGDKTTSGDGQLIDLGKYGIRYQGADPDNYVYFNCSDYSNQSEQTCETWRIIGVVDGKVKITKLADLKEMVWDANGTTNWKTATLQTYLNGEYYEGLSDDTQKLISSSNWYLGAASDDNTKDIAYELERKQDTDNIINTNIGLMYLSDYGYALLEDSQNCTATTTFYDQIACFENNWLDDWYGEAFGSIWTITPSSEHEDKIMCPAVISGMGVVADSYKATSSSDVGPSVYLVLDIEMMVGDGSLEKPYQISLK